MIADTSQLKWGRLTSACQKDWSTFSPIESSPYILRLRSSHIFQKVHMLANVEGELCLTYLRNLLEGSHSFKQPNYVLPHVHALMIILYVCMLSSPLGRLLASHTSVKYITPFLSFLPSLSTSRNI